jgi:hypothetical protein
MREISRVKCFKIEVMEVDDCVVTYNGGKDGDGKTAAEVILFSAVPRDSFSATMAVRMYASSDRGTMHVTILVHWCQGICCQG